MNLRARPTFLPLNFAEVGAETMKNWMKIALCLAIVGSVVTPTLAQDAGPRGQGNRQQRANGQQDQMRKIEAKVLAQLKLTTEQKAAIDALNKKFEEDLKKLREEMRGQGARGKPAAGAGQRPGAGEASRQENPMRGKMRELMDTRRKNLMKILTKEQGATYQKLMKEEMEKLRKERGQGGGGQRRGGAGGGGIG